MLGMNMQFDISIRLTPQVTTIICHHMKKVLLKEKRKRKKIQKKYGGIRPKLICSQKYGGIRLYLFTKNSKKRLDESLLYQ